MGDGSNGGFWEAGGGTEKKVFAWSAGKVLWDLLGRSLGFLVSILIARGLGAAGFGRYAVLWYLAWMAAQFTDMGLHLVVLRDLSREASRAGLRAALGAKAVLTLLSLGGILLAAGSGAFASDGERTSLVLLYGTALVGSWVELSGVILRSRGHLALEGGLLFLLRAGWLAGAAAALQSGGDIRALGNALLVASVPAVIAATFLLHRHREAGASGRPLSPGSSLRLIRQAAPLALTAIITLVYLRLDLLLLAWIRGDRDAGVFTAAFRLLEALFVFSGGVVAGAFPWIASRARREELSALSALVIGLLLWIAIPAGTGFLILSRPIVEFLYGAGYEPSAAPLRWLGIAAVAVYINALTTHLLIATERGTTLVAVMLVRLAVGLGVDLSLIPSLGASGAAMAVAAAESSLAVLSVIATRRQLSPAAILKAAWEPLVCSLVMAVAVSLIPFVLPLRILLGALIYLLAFAAIRTRGQGPLLPVIGSSGAGS